MNRKQMFLKAVRILAPGDEFILEAAQLVKEEALPARPGGVALEFVAAMEKVRGREAHRAKATSKKSFPKDGGHDRPSLVVHGGGEEAVSGAGDMHRAEVRSSKFQVRGSKPMSLRDAMRVKSAEYWLKLGQPAEALMELERLPEDARNHPWAVRVHVTAIGAARELDQVAVHE